MPPMALKDVALSLWYSSSTHRAVSEGLVWWQCQDRSQSPWGVMTAPNPGVPRGGLTCFHDKPDDLMQLVACHRRNKTDLCH